MYRIALFMALIILLSAKLSFAEPPLITEEAETLDKGEMQAELTAEFSLDDELVNEVRVEERESEIEARFIYGIVDGLEMEIEVPYAWVREKESSFGADGFEEESVKAHGYGDVGLELKWKFYDENDLKLALKPMFAFPTGNEEKELGTGRTSYGLMFAGTKEYDPIHLEFHVNVGIMHYNYKLADEQAQNRSNIWHVSLATTKQVVKGLTACADIGMEANPDRSSNTKAAYFLAGFMYSVTKKLDVSFGAKVGLTKPEPDLAILPGLVWKF